MRLRQAEFPRDTPIVARHFDDYVDAILGVSAPILQQAILSKYPVSARTKAVSEFATIHAPPRGALLLSEADDGTPMGCGMMRMLTPEIAELQRIYIAAAGRGQGAGRRITQALCDAAQALGASSVRLDTARAATVPVALYRSMGFAEVPPYHDDYPELQPHLIFFERPL